jgi:long-chain acyl-CoA synthetase
VRRETLRDLFGVLEGARGEFLVYDNGYREWSFTYPEVTALAWGFAARLRDAGVARGEKVVVWGENRPGWVAALWGCVLWGAVAVPVDYRSSAASVEKIARIVKARILVVGDEVEGEVPGLEPWPMAAVERGPGGRFPVEEGHGAELVQIVFTSGATGEPKGVEITHRNLLANLTPVEHEIAKYKKWGRPFFPLRFVNLLPLSHLFGQTMAAFIPPMLGGTVVFLRSLDPGSVVEQVRRRKVSVIVCVPRILELLKGYAEGRFGDTLREGPAGERWWWKWFRYRRLHGAFGWKFWAFVVGAAPLPPDLERFWKQLGFVVIQGYGLTETAPIVTLNHPFHAREGSVGKAMPGVEIKIAEDGEILVRGENVTRGYYGDAAGAAFEDGWLRTGDLGKFGDDGGLLILGRKKDVIVTPDGLNVYPEDVERALEAVKGVREAAVIGPDAVRAVLVLEEGVSGEDAVRQANETLEAHQKVRRFDLWPHGALPRTEGTGKLKRAAVREWAASGVAPAASGAEGLPALLARYAPGREIGPETRIEDLGLTSLDRVELLMELERKMGVTLDEGAVARAATVSELEQLRGVEAAPESSAHDDFPRWARGWWARCLRALVRETVMLPLTRYYARLQVRGVENLHGLEGPLLFAANHTSHMDVAAILAALPRPWRGQIAPAMMKEYYAAHFHPERYPAGERWKIRLQYWLVVLFFQAFPIPQREAGVGGTLRYAGELASQGLSILIFPEGERIEGGRMAPFRPGAAMMASRLGLRIIPVRLRGLDKVLGKGMDWAARGDVEVVFGEPMQAADEDWAEGARRMEEAVRRL